MANQLRPICDRCGLHLARALANLKLAETEHGKDSPEYQWFNRARANAVARAGYCRIGRCLADAIERRISR